MSSLKTAVLLAVLSGSSAFVLAQTTPPPAPLPTLVASAQKLFLGNAGTNDNDDCRRAYNELYAGLTADGRFQMVLDPSSADMILELHYEVTAGAVTGPGSSVSTAFARQFRLILIDPRTHAVVWSLTEVENNAILHSNRNKNLDAAVTSLLNDFRMLGQTSLGGPPTTRKERFSQEKPQ